MAELPILKANLVVPNMVGESSYAWGDLQAEAKHGGLDTRNLILFPALPPVT